MKQYLFVYGTLSKDRAPKEIASAVKRLRYVGAGHTQGRLYDLGKFPGAKLDSFSRSKVLGKIYELPDDPELLSRLDRYEEFDPQNPSGSLFVRKQVSISRLNRSRIIGWAYEYNGDISSSKVIKSGDYLKIAA